MLVSVTESGRFWDKVQGMEAWDMAETLPGISILLGCSGCSVASRLSPEGGSWGARQVHLMQDQLGPSLGHLGWSVQSSLKEQESGKRGELATVRDPNKAWSPRKLRGACVAPRLCGSELGVFPEFFQNKPPTEVQEKALQGGKNWSRSGVLKTLAWPASSWGRGMKNTLNGLVTHYGLHD